MKKKRLREGFTTGSAAAAAAKAAALYITGVRGLKQVEIPLPVGGRLAIPVCSIEPLGEAVRATVIKDAGDDPDVTHKARISCIVEPLSAGPAGIEPVVIQGGEGVGRVTRPGLPVAVGEAAVNPVPREQIRNAVLEALEGSGIQKVSVTIEVARGREIAEKTLNPRLGIVGGISILGTRGTVKPFSHESYRQTIELSMEVARRSGSRMVALSTGGKSEGFLRRLLPGPDDLAFVQVGDYFSFSLETASKKGFREIIYACFFGKLVKMAQGNANTHAGRSRIDFLLLSRWAEESGLGSREIESIAKANTAREALSVIRDNRGGGSMIQGLIKKALCSARRYAGPSPILGYYVFDFKGDLLGTGEDKGE